MDTKITLSFNESVIVKAKKFAEDHNISLSRLTEMLYEKITSGNYKNLEDLPISSWVSQLSEGEVEYKTRPRTGKSIKQAYFKSRK